MNICIRGFQVLASRGSEVEMKIHREPPSVLYSSPLPIKRPTQPTARCFNPAVFHASVSLRPRTGVVHVYPISPRRVANSLPPPGLSWGKGQTARERLTYAARNWVNPLTAARA